MDTVRQSLQSRNKSVGVDPDLPRRTLTARLDVDVARDQKPGAASCEIAIEFDQVSRDVAVSRAHGFGCRSPNKSISQFERADAAGDEIKRSLHGFLLSSGFRVNEDAPTGPQRT